MLGWPFWAAAPKGVNDPYFHMGKFSVKIRYKGLCGVARGSDGWEFNRGVGRGVGNKIDRWEVD